MRIAYFDCFSGVAGDMTLAALIHAGLDPQVLHNLVANLDLPGVALETETVKRFGIAACHVNVRIDASEQKAHRHLPQIVEIIYRAGLSDAAQRNAIAVFERLAEAEAAVHGTTPEKVHFHEVGAADAIVDIVGACVGLDALGIERVTCSAVPTGSGTVNCAHGRMPVPAPATAILLKGVPLAPCEEPGELTTPTGAALVTTLAQEFGPMPAMQTTAIGYGAGTRAGQTRPNVLRIFIGESATAEGAGDTVMILETQLDDANGQVVAHAVDRLLEAGALDAHIVPIIMKKGRPGQLIRVLSPLTAVPTLERVLLTETPTLGVRRYETRRSTLVRRHETVQTRFGAIRVKIGQLAGSDVQAWPEYDDCVAATREYDVPLREVQEQALWAWRQQAAQAAP